MDHRYRGLWGDAVDAAVNVFVEHCVAEHKDALAIPTALDQFDDTVR
jgi:hypothetical protein